MTTHPTSDTTPADAPDEVWTEQRIRALGNGSIYKTVHLPRQPRTATGRQLPEATPNRRQLAPSPTASAPEYPPRCRPPPANTSPRGWPDAAAWPKNPAATPTTSAST
jgi:hypothetical protein